MLLSGKAYEQRLEAFLLSTMRLIMDLDSLDKELAERKLQVTANPDYSEEEVVTKLVRMKQEYLASVR